MLQQITFENKNKNSSNPIKTTLTDQNINQIKICVNNIIDYLNTNELFILSGTDGNILSLSTFVTRNEFNNLSGKYISKTQGLNYVTIDQTENIINSLLLTKSYITQYEFINTLKDYSLKINVDTLSDKVLNITNQFQTFQNNIYYKIEIDNILSTYYYQKSNVYNKEQVNNLLNNFCSTGYIQNIISGYNTKNEISSILSSYYLKSDFLQIYSDLLTFEQLQDYLTLNYYTKDEIDDMLNFNDIKYTTLLQKIDDLSSALNKF